jgi:hydrogenase assembly chaperone HypC/HupF
MCVGIPGRVILIKDKKVKIKQGDHSHWIDISPLDEKVKEGDYLLTYQGVAINKISTEEAEEILKLMNSTCDTRVEGSN